jgi:hypothetical protein
MSRWRLAASSADKKKPGMIVAMFWRDAKNFYMRIERWMERNRSSGGLSDGTGENAAYILKIIKIN